jgi:hypothetical protein
VAITDTAPTNRHPDVEAWLDDRHVTWTFEPELPLGQIDIPAGLANQARMEALDDDVVDRYTADIERGDTFPPVLLNRVGRKLVPLGGNHRLAGANRAHRPTIAAYIVIAEPEMATRLMYEDNRRHGLPPGEDERLVQAVHLINNGYKLDAAAEVVGLSRGKVERALGAVKADQRAAELGVRTWALLPKTVRWRLGSIRSDPVFAEAANLAATTAMGSGDVYDMVTALSRTRSDKDALTLIGHLTEERAAQARKTAGGHIRQSTPRSRLIGNLTGVLCASATDVRAACPDAQARQALARRCDETITHLEQIRKTLR